MKKCFVVFLIFAMLLLCSCAANTPDTGNNGEATPSEQGGTDPVKPDEPATPTQPSTPAEPPKTDEPVQVGTHTYSDIDDGVQTLILVATYTNNARLTSPVAATVERADELAFVPVGTKAAQAGIIDNVIYCLCDGDTSTFDDFTGLPVKVEFKGGKVANLTAAKMITGFANDFTTEKSLYYFRGEQISVDYAKIKNYPDQYAWCQSIGGWWLKYDNDDFIFGNHCDEEYTLADSDGDGKYDFFRKTRIVNGLQLNLEASKEGVGVTFTNCGYGSDEASGWFNNGTLIPYELKGSLAGKTLQEIGNAYLNVKVIRNNEKGTRMAGQTIKACCEIYPAETVSGTLEKYTPSKWTEFSVKDNTTTVNGATYGWSDCISTNADCDGVRAFYSGRLYLTQDNIGAPITLVLDTAGNIVKADINNGIVPGIEYTTLEMDNGTQAAAVLDVGGWWHSSLINYTEIDRKIKMLHLMGIRRVYVVTSNPGYPSYGSSAGAGPSSRTSFLKNIKAFADAGFAYPDFAIVKACHELNMECYATYKPYEGGNMVDIPVGVQYDSAVTAFPGFAGQTIHLDAFNRESLLNGKDYRIVRRKDASSGNLDGTVDRITVDFITDAYNQRNATQRREEFTAYSSINADIVAKIADGQVYTNKNQHKTYGINLWISPDNYHYALYDGDYSYQYKAGSKVLYDANGDPMFDGAGKRVITLEITGVAIDDYFCAITFDNTEGLKIDCSSWMHVYAGGREIYTSKTEAVRNAGKSNDNNPDDYIWGRNGVPAAHGGISGIKIVKGTPVATPTNTADPDSVDRAQIAQRFYLYGFNFNFETYTGLVRSGVAVICAGRGAEQTFTGGHCEAYPEVRAYWLSHIKELIDGGFDGIVIRLQGHACTEADFKNFGYNEPIVEKYKELYGQAAYNTLMDPDHHVTDEEYIRIMRIRGDFFMIFAEDASELCHKYGIEFSVMLREAYCDPIVSSRQDEATWWCMPKVVLDWKRVVELNDFITIKDYIHKTSEVSINAKEIREYAHSLGKKVWIQCYDDQGGMFKSGFFTNADKDPAIDGIMLYELTGVESYFDQNLGQMLQRWGFKLKK